MFHVLPELQVFEPQDSDNLPSLAGGVRRVERLLRTRISKQNMHRVQLSQVHTSMDIFLTRGKFFPQS